jgi:hypothetical protein
MFQMQMIMQSARRRGEQYVALFQRQQHDAENLTFTVSGTKGEVNAAVYDFCTEGWGAHGGYSHVGTFQTALPWDEHEKRLDSLAFVW